MENLTYEQVLALFAKTEAQIANTDAQIAENNKKMLENDEEIKRILARMDASDAQFKAEMKKMAQQVGNITDALGRFAEAQVEPKIKKLFKKQGIILDTRFQRFLIEDKKTGEFLMELDFLLINTEISLVVESKHHLRQKDIDAQLERMEKLSQHPHKFMQGTRLLCAVSGMIMSEEVVNYAIKKGFYVVKPNGENVKVANPKNFQPRVWQLAV